MTDPEKPKRLTAEEAFEDIGRVGKALQEPQWWQTLVKNEADAEAVFELARECGYKDVKPGEVERIKAFLKRLSEGMYIGPLETYEVKWSTEKIARDIWQNFFDANNYTLDGILPEIETYEIPDKPHSQKNMYRIRIQGQQEYDFRKLLHFGGTSKEQDVRAAGGFGEGAKIAAFLMLRDYGAERVKFGSGDWVLEYYLENVPEEQYDKPIRGLHVQVTKREHQPGNFVEFETNIPDIASNIQHARDLFYHSENSDFKNSTLNNSVGGFRYEGKNGRGNFYEAGQRRHVVSKDKWKTVEGLTIWTWNKISAPRDRDRGAYNEDELLDQVLRPLVMSMKKEEVEKALHDLADLWDTPWDSEGHYIAPEKMGSAIDLLEILVDRAARYNLQFSFGNKVIAAENKYRLSPEEQLLFNRGYRILRPVFVKLGVSKAEKVISDWEKHLRVEKTPEERQMIELLRTLLKEAGFEEGGLPDIWLFSQKDEKSLVHGRWTPDHVWMAREALESFADALTTYIHELTHESYPGHDANFAYQFGNDMRYVFDFIGRQPDVYARIFNEYMLLGQKVQKEREQKERGQEGRDREL
jgi:hypothetical protein